MAKRKGYKVNSTIVTPFTEDSFPVVDSNDVAGGLMFLNTKAELLTIPEPRRKLGMFVYIISEDKHYKLIDNKAVLDTSCWEEYELISKKYVDDAIASIGNGGGSAVDLTEYAKKSDIPDVSGFETTQHAEGTYATKTEFETFKKSVPKILNTVYELPENPENPLVFEFELPEGTVGLEVKAVAETEEVSGTNDPIVEINYAGNPISEDGISSNEFGIALAGSDTPTAEDFVIYGE